MQHVAMTAAAVAAAAARVCVSISAAFHHTEPHATLSLHTVLSPSPGHLPGLLPVLWGEQVRGAERTRGSPHSSNRVLPCYYPHSSNRVLPCYYPHSSNRVLPCYYPTAGLSVPSSPTPGTPSASRGETPLLAASPQASGAGSCWHAAGSSAAL
jgi:hypothetical protein